MSTRNNQGNGEIELRRGTRPRRRPNGVYLPSARSRITNGKFLLPNIDNRSLWVRRFRDIRALHLADLGGEEATSAAERSIVRRAALLTCELERLEMLFAEAGGASDHKLEVYTRTANTLRRLLEAVGIPRRARDVTPPSLDQYLAQGHRAQEAAE